ncbi:YkgJ family cysteine cluster protein [Methanospirillum sp.]|uniref:YkgJ family cysteine cluster protein n=1 Tax=Methanospirillum sp. TaxID=45200 RepID=UPI0035A0C267
MSGSYISRKLSGLIVECDLLLQWKEKDLADIICDVGFSCMLCGRCCTTEFNGHVFLLDSDAKRIMDMDPSLLIPAPEFELADEMGNFYVSGYALRVLEDGSCIFLSKNRCQIYNERFAICRIYPYMLHREPDRRKNLEFRQISGLNEHGEYNCPVSDNDAHVFARETIAYEHAWLMQMIDFYTAAGELFEQKRTRHIRAVYDKRIQEFRKGTPVCVHVWYNGKFVPVTMRCEDYRGFGWP